MTLNAGTELRGSGTVNLANKVVFPGSATSTVSTSGTLDLNYLDMSATDAIVVFGSAGNAGTVVFAPPTMGSAVAIGTTLEVAFGTLRNGGGLNGYTTECPTSVNPGATLSLNDVNTEVYALYGGGSVTLGSKATTQLTLDGGIFAGVVSGAGQVITTSTVTLTGANTYTGGTTVSGGYLNIGNGGATGSVAGNITDDTLVYFDRSNATTFAGKISGTGVVFKVGAGMLTLTGANTYSGGTTLVNGTISINNASALGTGTVTLDVGTELRGTGTVNLANQIDFANGTSILSTSGTLEVGTLSMTGASTNAVFGSSGNAGVIVVGPSATSTTATTTTLDVAYGTLRDGGGLGYFLSNAASTTINTGATLSLNDHSSIIADLEGTGSVSLGTNAATTLTLATGHFGGIISGAGQVVKNFTTTVTLSGANIYTGGTTLNAGTTLINNTSGSGTGTGPVQINNGATLGGSGTVRAMTLNSGGTIAPSAGTPGTGGTKFHGSSLLWESGGALTFQIGATADELLLTGALTKNATGTYTIDIEDAGIVGEANYTLITFASSNFLATDFTLNLPANFNGMLVKTSTSLILEDLVHSEMASGNNETTGAVTETTHTMSVPTIEPDSSVNLIKNVPEPGSATLLLLGLGSFLTGRRRRNAP